MDFTKLEKKYGDFYAPGFEIEIEGENIVRKGVEIVSLNVDNTLSGADRFSFTVNNVFDISKRELMWLDELFSFGKKVAIKMGYLDKLSLMMIGLITSIRTGFPAGGLPQLEVSGYDLSYCLMHTKKKRSTPNAKHSEVAQAIASDHGLKSNVDDTEVTFPKVEKKEEESDFQFLEGLAKRNYFEFFVFGDTLYFRSADTAKNEAPVATLEWGKGLVSFSPELNISKQVTEVEVKGWDIRAKREIIGRARKGDEEGREQNRKSGGELVQAICKEKVVERVSRPVYSQQEADKLAKAILNQRAEELVTGSGESIGIPEILAGKNIMLKGLATKFSKPYYIEKTKHTISSSGYRTTFNVKESTI